MAEHFPNNSIPVSYVAVPRKRLALDEYITLSAHELVAGCRACSVKWCPCQARCISIKKRTSSICDPKGGRGAGPAPALGSARIFTTGVQPSASSAGSMWVNRKLRRECPGNPSKMGIEVVKRMARREPGQAKSGPFLLKTCRSLGWWRLLGERHLDHSVPCPIPHGAPEGGEGGLWVRTGANSQQERLRSYSFLFLTRVMWLFLQ